MKLKEAAEIWIGYSLRGEVAKFQNANGDLLLVQAGDLPAFDFFINQEKLTRISLSSNKNVLLLQSGDVLLAYRGGHQSRLRASVFRSHSEQSVLASSSLYIIRPNTNVVLPEYLVLYLNSRIGQRNLQSLATGAVVRAVPLGALRDCQIPVPEKEKQKSLVALSGNIQSQNSILRNRIELQEKFVDDLVSLSTQLH